MKKRLISLLLTMLMLVSVSVFADTSSEIEYTPESDFYISGNTIKEYLGDRDALCELNIPPVINGVEIKVLGLELFGKCYNLKKVIIPEGITTIDVSAFYYCTALTEITIPSTVTEINTYAFQGCKSLTNITYGGTESQWYELLAKVKATDASSYRVLLAANVTFAGEDIPEKPTIEPTPEPTATPTPEPTPLPTAEPTVAPTPEAPEEPEKPEEPSTPSENVPFNIDSTGMITEYFGTDTDIVIPSEINGTAVRGIGNAAFRYNTNITSVIISEGVQIINSSAFMGCSSLTSVTLPSTIRSMGGSVFAQCTSLTSVIFADGITTIGSSAFGNTAIKSIELPKSIRSLSPYAFANCRQLESVIIRSNITKLTKNTFVNCTELKTLHLPSSLIAIEDNAIQNCTAITAIYFDGTTEQWEQIQIGASNEAIFNAKIHYLGDDSSNSSGGSGGGGDGYAVPTVEASINYDGMIEVNIELPSELEITDETKILVIGYEQDKYSEIKTQYAAENSIIVMDNMYLTDIEVLVWDSMRTFAPLTDIIRANVR